MSESLDDYTVTHLTMFNAFYDSLAANAKGETVVKFRIPAADVPKVLSLLDHPGEAMQLVVGTFDFD